MPGGVCAVLDYEVEMMAEYVAEMATRLTSGNASVSAPFRKFVSQILTSTRLPSTTILLGMNYMAKRLNMMTIGTQRPKLTEGQVWRMLTTGFLLGSKFLDDNTFQNRSWSEVSGIPVQELNTLEYEWLDAIGWNLYVNLDSSSDYNAWLKSWAEWRAAKEQQKAQAARERHMPVVPRIDTDVFNRRHAGYSTWHQQQIAEYERLQSLRHKQAELSPPTSLSAHETWYPARNAWAPTNQAHPLTPPDSGYGTPDYSINSASLNSAASQNAHYNDWFSRGISNGYSQSRHQPSYQNLAANRRSYHNAPHSVRQPASAHPGYYGHGHGHHNIWDPSIVDCNCSQCGFSAKSASYLGMAQGHGFGQPVMG